ncbi:MAG TPA: helix-turn-helix domain-containing protein [Acidimicrobiales bacterium]
MTSTSVFRADARRNREKLLEAAGAVFAEQGVQGSLDEIARRAGVGAGTLYRHFPTREALVEAVFLDRRGQSLVLLEVACEADDPWVGFSEWLLAVSRMLAEDRGFADVIITGNGSKDQGALRKRSYVAMRKLVSRAVASGQIRSDYTVDDALLLLLGAAGIAHRSPAEAVAAVERFMVMALDGVRETGARRGPAPPSVQVFTWFGPNTLGPEAEDG